VAAVNGDFAAAATEYHQNHVVPPLANGDIGDGNRLQTLS